MLWPLGKAHSEAVLDVACYVGLTSRRGLTFGGSDKPLGFWCDANFAACQDTRRSTTGWAVMMYGGAVSWASKKQPTTAASTMAVEYQACGSAARGGFRWRVPFLVCMSLPPLGLLPMLLLPCLPTVMTKFLFGVSPTVLLWFRVLVMPRFLTPKPFSPLLLHFPSYCSPSTCLAGWRPMPSVKTHCSLVQRRMNHEQHITSTCRC
jgi:hypothetical protein